MMKLAVLFGLVALTLQVSGRHLIRRSTDDSEELVFDAKLIADNYWHGEPDKGFPDFDGNPFKRSLVELSSFLAGLAIEALEEEEDVPEFAKSMIKGLQRSDWKSFDEYLDYWGAVQATLMVLMEGDSSESVESLESPNNGEAKKE